MLAHHHFEGQASQCQLHQEAQHQKKEEETCFFLVLTVGSGKCHGIKFMGETSDTG